MRWLGLGWGGGIRWGTRRGIRRPPGPCRAPGAGLGPGARAGPAPTTATPPGGRTQNPTARRRREPEPTNRPTTKTKDTGEGLSEFLRPRPHALTCGDTGPGGGAVCSQDPSRDPQEGAPLGTPQDTPQDTGPGGRPRRRTHVHNGPAVSQPQAPKNKPAQRRRSRPAPPPPTTTSRPQEGMSDLPGGPTNPLTSANQERGARGGEAPSEPSPEPSSEAPSEPSSEATRPGLAGRCTASGTAPGLRGAGRA